MQSTVESFLELPEIGTVKAATAAVLDFRLERFLLFLIYNVSNVCRKANRTLGFLRRNL